MCRAGEPRSPRVSARSSRSGMSSASLTPSSGRADSHSTHFPPSRRCWRTSSASLCAFSLHNPVVAGWSADDDEVAGMVNAAGARLRERFAYCSDSQRLAPPAAARRARGRCRRRATARAPRTPSGGCRSRCRREARSHARSKDARRCDAGALRPRVGVDPRARPQVTLVSCSERARALRADVHQRVHDRRPGELVAGLQIPRMLEALWAGSIPARSNFSSSW